MKEFLLNNLLSIALAFGGGAMSLGAFYVRLEIAALRTEVALTQKDVAYMKETLDELRGVRRRQAAYVVGKSD